MKIDSVNSELTILYHGDFLSCQACGAWIFHIAPTAVKYRYRDINNAYTKHAVECFGLKRLIIINKNKS